MNELLLKKLDEFYKLINENDEIKEMIYLKNEIYKDKILKEKLEKYKNISNKYDKEYIEIKKEIINNPLVKRYHMLENELYFIVLEINQKLNELIDKKRCSSESN